MGRLPNSSAATAADAVALSLWLEEVRTSPRPNDIVAREEARRRNVGIHDIVVRMLSRGEAPPREAVAIAMKVVASESPDQLLLSHVGDHYVSGKPLKTGPKAPRSLFADIEILSVYAEAKKNHTHRSAVMTTRDKCGVSESTVERVLRSARARQATPPQP